MTNLHAKKNNWLKNQAENSENKIYENAGLQSYQIQTYAAI